MLVSLSLVAVGLVVLAVASDQFVVGAARLARILDVPPLVIGVAIVGFGTSAPELLVSALAAVGDEPAVAVGNVVGSNLANLTLLLGVGALLTPLAVDSRVVRREAPVAVAATVAFAVAVQGGLTRPEGFVLLVALAAALAVVLRRGEASDPIGPEALELVGEDGAVPAHRRGPEAVRTLVGLVLTVAAAQVLLTGALDVADRIGLAAGVVGATLVAIGTSLPELVTVVQSARRGEPDLIVGNLLGSNVFNALGVAGVAGLVGPAALDAPELTTVATAAALVAALAAWALMRTGGRVSRTEGAVLVIGYLVAVVALGT